MCSPTVSTDKPLKEIVSSVNVVCQTANRDLMLLAFHLSTVVKARLMGNLASTISHLLCYITLSTPVNSVGTRVDFDRHRSQQHGLAGRKMYVPSRFLLSAAFESYWYIMQWIHRKAFFPLIHLWCRQSHKPTQDFLVAGVWFVRLWTISPKLHCI